MTPIGTLWGIPVYADETLPKGKVRVVPFIITRKHV